MHTFKAFEHGIRDLVPLTKNVKHQENRDDYKTNKRKYEKKENNIVNKSFKNEE